MLYLCYLFLAIKDISHHLEITRDGGPKPQAFPKSPDTVNFDLEVARKLNQDEPLDLPEIVDASQKITKAKAKKRKGKSKIPQRQESKEAEVDDRPQAGFEVDWDFDDRKDETFLKDERLRQAGYDTTNGKNRGRFRKFEVYEWFLSVEKQWVLFFNLTIREV